MDHAVTDETTRSFIAALRHLEQTRAALEATYEAVGGHRLESRPDRRRQREA